GTFETVDKTAEAELSRAAGWEESASSDQTTGIVYPKDMDALFRQGDRAVIVYRQRVNGQVRVRVWLRSPTLWERITESVTSR
ncbi:MAG TPA: hypothetical protein VMI31_15100, partial [Fimbriimonadaceae bacterium]|nr:hypothetical protein [Fimbriimonadaceae bacterium]